VVYKMLAYQDLARRGELTRDRPSTTRGSIRSVSRP